MHRLSALIAAMLLLPLATVHAADPLKPTSDYAGTLLDATFGYADTALDASLRYADDTQGREAYTALGAAAVTTHETYVDEEGNTITEDRTEECAFELTLRGETDGNWTLVLANHEQTVSLNHEAPCDLNPGLQTWEFFAPEQSTATGFDVTLVGVDAPCVETFRFVSSPLDQSGATFKTRWETVCGEDLHAFEEIEGTVTQRWYRVG